MTVSIKLYNIECVPPIPVHVVGEHRVYRVDTY